MRVGILGGTFDPIHLGHLSIATDVKHCLQLDSILFVPAKKQPLKNNTATFSDDMRFRMVKEAIKDSKYFQISDVDYQRTGPSYTVDMLEEIQRQTKLPPQNLFFILGTDAFYEIKKWRNYQKLFELANFVVVTRANVDIELDQLFTIAGDLGFCYNVDINEAANFGIKEKKDGTFKKITDKNNHHKTPSVSASYATNNSPTPDKNTENIEYCRSHKVQEHHNISKQGKILPRMLKNLSNKFNLHLSIVEANPVHISSTEIRTKLKNNESIEDFVPRAVLNLIKEEYTTS